MLGLGNILSKGGAVLQKFPNEYSFNFDSSNDYLQLPIPFSYTNHTISAWYYANSGDKYIFDSRDGGSDGIALAVNADGTLWYAVRGSGGNSVTSSSGSLNAWNHVAVTYNGSTAKIYLNGSEVGSGTFSDTISTTTNARIGAISYTTSGYFDGLIDEVALWDTALSASTISKIASKPVDLTKYSASNLKLWLRAGDKVQPESTTSIARADFSTELDGTSYIDAGTGLGTSLGDSYGNNLTISAWFKLASTGTTRGIFEIGAFTGSHGQINLWYSSDGTIKYRLNGGNWTRSVSFTDLGWNHISIIYDASSESNSKLYLNGSSVGSASGTFPSSLDLDGLKTIIGAIESSSFNWEGILSSLSIHQTALPANDIALMAKSRFTPMRDNRFSVMDFDGTNDYVDCGTGLCTSLGDGYDGGLSVSMWFKADVTSGVDDGLFNFSSFGGSSGELFINLNGNNINVRFADAVTSITSFTDIAGWHHLVAVYDGSNNIQYLYLDGVSKDSDANSNTLDLDGLKTIIGGYFNSSYVLNGKISSVAVYNVAKSADEVYAIYQQGITYDESSLSGLVGYWRMGDDTSKAYPTIADSSSNSNDGTITNGASDDIVQQMVAGYDMGSFRGTEELGATVLKNPLLLSHIDPHGNNTGELLADGTLKFTNPSGGGGSQYGVWFYFSTNSTSILEIVPVTGQLYKLSFNGYYDGGGSQPYWYLYGQSSGDVTITPTTTPTDYEIYFTGSGATGRFQANTPSAGQSVYIKDFEIKSVLSSEVDDTKNAVIDVSNPTLGAELVDADASTLKVGGTYLGTGSEENTDTYGWKKQGSNTLTNDNGALKVTGSTSTGAYTYFVENYDFGSTAIVVGNTYKVEISAKVDSGNSIGLIVRDNASTHLQTQTVTNTSFQTFTYYFTAADASSNWIGMSGVSASEAIYIDSWSVKQVQGNVGKPTSMDATNFHYTSVLPDQSFLVGNSSPYNFIDLDGSDAYIKNESFTGHQSDTGSISFWVTPRRISGNQHFVSLGGTTTTGATRDISLQGGADLKIVAYGSTTDTGFNLSADTLYHIVFTWDSTSAVAYVDNSSASLTIGALVKPQGTKLSIGVRVWDYAAHSEADFSNVGVWNKVLSSSDVSKIFNAGRNSSLLDDYSENLVAYYAFGALDITGLEDTDSTIYDRSGNSVHGTTSGVATGDLKSPPNATPNGYAKGDTNRSTTIP